MSIIWGIIVLLLIFLELMTVDIIALWYALGAIVALIISFASSNFFLEFIICIIIGTISMIFLRKKTILFLKKKAIITSADKLVGEVGIVTKAISKKQYGEVKVNKKRWTAYADTSIAKSKEVIILKVDGVKLEVEPKK